jgi:hypothetical protein
MWWPVIFGIGDLMLPILCVLFIVYETRANIAQRGEPSIDVARPLR